MVCGGEKDTAWGECFVGEEGEEGEWGWRVYGGVEALCKIKEIRSKIPRVKVRAGRESALLGCGCRGFGGAVCWGVWGVGCSAVKERKETVTFFLTRDKHEKKVGFGGTGEIIGGAGRSPHIEDMCLHLIGPLIFFVSFSLSRPTFFLAHSLYINTFVHYVQMHSE